jgi:hypothetical protein
MRRFLWALTVTLAFLPESAAQALNVYFGNLHSHTAYSDGTGTPQRLREAFIIFGRLEKQCRQLLNARIPFSPACC